MSTLAHTTTGPARWQPTARDGRAAVRSCAALLVIVGSFLPLFAGSLSSARTTIEVTVTPWSPEVTARTGAPGRRPHDGYPLVFAAIVLAVRRGLCWFAAHPGARAGAGRAAGLTTAIGAAFLVGTMWTIALHGRRTAWTH